MWENNKKNLLPVEEAVLSERHIDFNTLLSKNTFDFLHCEFQKNTNNFLTLGNLLALANQKGTFKKLLKYDRSLAFHQDSTPLRFTPLHIAAKSGSIEILQVYQELKIDLNIEDGFGNTAAHIACLNNRHEFLDTITKFNIDLTKKNQDGRTALHIAATQIQTDCVELLSKNLELVRERDGDGNLPLHLSCKFLRNKNASILLNADPESKNVVNDDMNTPLHLACGSGDLETVSLLYNHGVGVELANIFGETPLIISALHGHGEIVDYLILNGVDILAQDLERETALHKAVFRQHKNVVLSLLEADKKLVRPKEKALVRIKDVDDEIPLHELPKFVNNPNYNIKNQIDILNKLLENGSKLTLKNERGESFFHLICYAGRKDVLEASLRYLMLNGKLEKFNPCSTDNKGHTFLHKAALGSHNHLIDYLISLKVPKNNADKEGYTPLFLAVKVGNYDFAKKLYEYGGHLKSSINIGQSIVHLSTQFKPPKILEQSLIHLILDREILCPESFKFLKWVLDKHPSLLFERDEEKRTPLHIIAERNHISALNLVLEWLPGSQEKNERYLWKKSASGFVAHEIAKNNQFYELERMIRNFPKDWLGSHHKKQSKVTQI